MTQIQDYRPEFKRRGVIYRVLLTMPFFVGERLWWRVVYQGENGEQVVKEFRTGRVKRGEDVVIE